MSFENFINKDWFVRYEQRMHSQGDKASKYLILGTGQSNQIISKAVVLRQATTFILSFFEIRAATVPTGNGVVF